MKQVFHSIYSVIFALFCFGHLAQAQSNLAGQDYIGVYQKYIGPIRGGECPMHPSCSVYGAEAMNNQSFYGATLSIADRLLRCGHDHGNYGLTLMDKGLKYADLPVGSSDGEGIYYRGRQPIFSYGDTLKDADQEKFVKWLIDEQRFREALLEIDRMRFFKEEASLELSLNRLLCLIALDELEAALFMHATEMPEAFQTHPEVQLRVAKAHYLLENYESAEFIAAEGMANAEDDYTSYRLNAYAGLAQARMGQWTEARATFASAKGLQQFKHLADAEIKIVDGLLASKQKKPIIAGTLSALVPGLGYAYAGHAQTGLSSLLINGLLAYATYTSFANDNYGMALLTGIFNLSFYLGNISGSAKSARRFNENKNREAIFQLEKFANY